MVPLIPDDVGDTIPFSKTLLGANSGQATGRGLIGAPYDVDIWRFASGPGSVSLALEGVSNYTHTIPGFFNTSYLGPSSNLPPSLYTWFEPVPRSNLDAQMSLLDAAGTVLKTWTNPNGVYWGSETFNLPSTVRR